MATEATTLSQTSTYQLTTHQHSGNMRISHMEVEHRKVQDKCRICNNSMWFAVNSAEVRELVFGIKNIYIPIPSTAVA